MYLTLLTRLGVEVEFHAIDLDQPGVVLVHVSKLPFAAAPPSAAACDQWSPGRCSLTLSEMFSTVSLTLPVA